MFFLLWVDSQNFCKMKLYKEYKLYIHRTRDALGATILSLVEKFSERKVVGLKQVSFVERVSYLRGSLKSHYINYEFSLLSGCE